VISQPPRRRPGVVFEIAWDLLALFGIWNLFQPITIAEFVRPAAPLAVMAAAMGVLMIFRQKRLARMQKRWESVWRGVGPERHAAAPAPD
jgi:hypothetical protein